MTKQTEALKLALEALEYISSHYMSLPKVGCMALAAIEEALAEQPAQQKKPVSIKAVAQKSGINLRETYIPTMDDAIAAGDSVLMNEQAALLRECRAALDSLIAQKPTLAGLLCGSTTLGNLKAELGAYRPQGVFGTSPQPAQQEPEFFTHSVEQPYDWSEWVCPDPQGYLMKCCDCGLVHEAQFGVVRYKSEAEREDCEKVDDPNLQAVFRMRRSEQWSPTDTAHRAGGLPMDEPRPQNCGTGYCSCIECPYEQPAQQEPVAYAVYHRMGGSKTLHWPEQHSEDGDHNEYQLVPLYTSPPASKPWVGLTDEEMKACTQSPFVVENYRAIEAKLKEKNA